MHCPSRFALVFVLAPPGLLAACAHGSRLVEGGNTVRIVTTEADTIVGRATRVGPYSVVVAAGTRDVRAVDSSMIRSLEIDYASVHRWARPVGCILAGIGWGSTAFVLADRGVTPWWAITAGAFTNAMLTWDCVASPCRWRPGRLEERREPDR